MLRLLTRSMLGLLSVGLRSTGAAALIGILGVLSGCWGDTSIATISPKPQLVSISVSPPGSSLAVGLTQQLTATGLYSDGSKLDLTSSVVWSSSAPSIATINAGGMATAVASGLATITATEASIAGTTTLMVTTAHLLSIGVTPAAPSIAVGTTASLLATGVYSDNSVHDITNSVAWLSTTLAVAGINSTGLVTAAATGSTRITATLDGVTSVGVTVNVTAAVLISIAVTPSVATIANGTQQQFIATGLYSDRSTQDLSRSAVWNASAPAVAAISNVSGSNGLAKATGTGATSITAAFGGMSSSPVTLTVTGATLVSIAVTPAVPSLVLGLNLQFRATGIYTDHSNQDLTSVVTWNSSATSVADISSASTTSGLVTSHSAGSTTIGATLGTVSATPVTLTVTAATLVSIGITPAAPSIALGTGQHFTASGIYTDNSTQDLTTSAIWVSSSAAVAAISNASGSNGFGLSLSTGSTTITAMMGSVLSSPVTLTVTAATLISVAVTPPNPSIALGTNLQFAAIGTYTDNSTQNLTTFVTWMSAFGAVASISNAPGSNGASDSLSAGSTMISAVSGSVTSSPVTLTVSAATLVSIAVTPATPSIALGTQQQLVATGIYTDNSTQNLTAQVTWASDNTAVATVSNVAGTQGLASSATTGATHINATLGSVASAPITLTVTSAALVSIAVTPPNPSIALGTYQQFAATGTYTDNSTQDLTGQVTWTSGSPQFASISNASGTQGFATSLAVGTTAIGAGLGMVNSGTVSLQVTAATLVSIAVTPATPSIALGTGQQFTAIGTYTDNSTQDLTSQATWTAGSLQFATISNASGSQGLATSMAVGSSAIGASLGTVNSPATVTLNVTPAVLVSIAVTPASPSIALGTNQQFAATGTYTDNSTQDLTSQVTWTSGSPQFATISNASGSQGLATSMAVGSTAIGATLGSVDSPATVTLSVTAATLVSIAVTPASPSIAAGSTEQFTATGTYTDGSTQDVTTQVTWTSATASVASISNASGTQGLATSMTLGTTVVMAGVGTLNSAGVTLTVTQNFTTPGPATWIVPAGVTSIEMVATGGGGGSGSSTVGGGGAIVVTTLSVTPGATFTLYIGGGGGGGLGGGGGSTNINPETASQIIAGGGGGGSLYGDGGNAGGVDGSGAGGGSSAGGGGSGGAGGAGASGGSTAGSYGNGGSGGQADYGFGGAGGTGSGTGTGGGGGFGSGGGGGGGYGGGGGGFQGGGGAGGSTGPSGSTYATGSNGGANNGAGGNGSIVITAL